MKKLIALAVIVSALAVAVPLEETTTPSTSPRIQSTELATPSTSPRIQSSDVQLATPSTSPRIQSEDLA